MINRIIIGSGKYRKVFPMHRDPEFRQETTKTLLDILQNPVKLGAVIRA